MSAAFTRAKRDQPEIASLDVLHARGKWILWCQPLAVTKLRIGRYHGSGRTRVDVGTEMPTTQYRVHRLGRARSVMLT